jgi:hypothetical protein
LRELNPALLKSVAPAGMSIHVPKGTLPQVETAFQAVPPNRRDAWRLHRLSTDDSFVTLARRYNTAASLVSSANHDELPDAGSFVVIPASYPGDRVVRTSARSTAKPTTRKAGARATPSRSAAPKAASRGKGSKVRASSPAGKNPTKAATPRRASGRPS